MKRREFIAGLGGAAAWSFTARAQQSRMPMVGFLHGGSPGAALYMQAAFHRGLKEAGYVEGQNVGIVYRYADDQYDQLPALVADLIREQVAVLGAFTPLAAQAAKKATATIPIVFTSSDPVKSGLVASLNRPGGNVTGVNVLTIDLEGRRLEILSELVPPSAPIAVLINPQSGTAEDQTKDVQTAAPRINRKILILNASSERDINSAFMTLIERQVAGLLVTGDPFFNNRREQLIGLAGRHSIPAIYEWRSLPLPAG